MVERSYQTTLLLGRQRRDAGAAGERALRLFRAALVRGVIFRLLALLRGRRSELVSLTTVEVGGGRAAGLRAVPLSAISGSEGRCADFDAALYPRDERTRDRWLSVASAKLRGVTLPPVSLIEVSGCYYIRDGHHRASVARALGEAYIDAEVVIWG